MGKYIQRQSHGFTLIEVLIALAILSISLTAVIKTTTQNIRDTRYLQDKTTANWVGLLIINEVRAGLIILPTSSDKLHDESTMLNKAWEWDAYATQTKNPRITEIHVEVFPKKSKDMLTSLVSFTYAE